MKQCSKCEVLKDEEEFSKDKRSKDGLTYNCKECRASYYREWRSNNEKYIKNRHKQKAGDRYGISLEEYKECMNTSDTCEICGSKGKLCYDHDHNTGDFRGILCDKCNLRLVSTEEEWLKVKKYMERYYG